MTIQFNVTVKGDAQSARAIAQVQQRITSRLRDAIQRAALDLMSYVKAQKLTGQVLNVRTGRLRRSITQRVEVEAGGKIVGLVGTNVSYGRVHELGFKGRVNVRGHTRKVKGKAVPIRAHSRQVDIPKRPFLGPSLNEKMPVYRQWMQDAIKGAARGPGA
jgi:phage gpG-like protein